MTYPDINPIALDLGFVQIYWYGIMYLLAFLSAYLLASYRTKQLNDWSKQSSKIIKQHIAYTTAKNNTYGAVENHIFYLLFAPIIQLLSAITC
jgi:prolipoprotein diacylglyceryltransferase